MKAARKKTIVLLICLVFITLLSGCTNWKKEYDALYVQHQNLRGRFDLERNEKGLLADEVSRGQQTIDELQRQIDELNKTPADASGFGEGYAVDFDATRGTVTVTLDDSILFDSGKATLKKATNASLDHVHSVLQQGRYAGKPIDVVGHTDSDPILRTKNMWKDNLELSSERALSVARYLIQKGIPDEDIRAVGCGASRPVASNANKAGKAKNRRVEIVVYLRG
ncbi:MAG: OmpA family protein [Phycisphaerales bacterium]|nr:MAG: OmpA family protein [Phycisphaerales bacterium]